MLSFIKISSSWLYTLLVNYVPTQQFDVITYQNATLISKETEQLF